MTRNTSDAGAPSALVLAGAAAVATAAVVGSGIVTPARGARPGDVPLTAAQASRFLSQAAIGYSLADVNALAGSTANTWLNAQFAMARPQTCWAYLVAHGYNTPANMNTWNGYYSMMWAQLMGSTDILRQRVGLALLNQWVVSILGVGTSWNSFAMAVHFDNLWNNAFGNYRNLMEAVTNSVPMGLYLSYLGSTKANSAGQIPDENYARELMQLFSIGLYQLNMDGGVVTSGGKPVPTYTQTDVSQLARVWTGYWWPPYPNTTPDQLAQPMAIRGQYFETGGSSFLGITVPPGASAAQARQIALDGLFNHPNVPPFVSKQLIQHLVTSNPSPAYIKRVATTFANNGSGVRGDMKAVIRAILTDTEARNDTAALASTSFGKLREPVCRLTQWVKAFKVTSPTGLWPVYSENGDLGETPGYSPSVFNWFRPGYTPPGTAIAQAGLVAPEFQILDEPHAVSWANSMQRVINNGIDEMQADYSAYTAIAANSQTLLNQLNLVLAANQISTNTIAQMKVALDTIGVTTSDGLLKRVKAAILLVMASPEYLVLR